MARELTVQEAQERYDRALAEHQAADARVGVPRHRGAESGTRRRSTPTQRKKEAQAWDRAIDTWKKVERAEKDLRRAKGRERQNQVNQAATVDLETLEPGDLIRYATFSDTRFGTWGRVQRLNKKTITCHPPEPGFDAPRVPYDRVLETRKATP